MTLLPRRSLLNKLKSIYIKPQNELFCKWHLSATKQWKLHPVQFIGSFPTKPDSPPTFPSRLSSSSSSNRLLTLSLSSISRSFEESSSVSSVPSLSSSSSAVSFLSSVSSLTVTSRSVASLSSVPFDLSLVQSRSFSSNQSRHSPRSNWDKIANLVQTLKEMTDDELLDRLDHLERINAKMRRILKWKRPWFQPEEGTLSRRAFAVDEDAGPVTVALLVTYLGWDLPAFSSAHPGVTTVQDAILDACYASGLAAEEEEEWLEELEGGHHQQEDLKERKDDHIVSHHEDEEKLLNNEAAFALSEDSDDDEYDDEGNKVSSTPFVRPPFVKEKERSSLKFIGCGRTDVSVSGTHQVVSVRLKRAKYSNNNNNNNNNNNSVDVESNNSKPKYHSVTNNSDFGDEISYAEELNHFLPPEIRILSWSVVRDDFSARFNCTQRSYTYHFPKGDLDIPSMRDAASRLVGYHDFQNFCKAKKELVKQIAHYGKDTRPVSQFFKCVQEAEIIEKKAHSGLTVCELRISANGFLWHQIRCFVSVLLLVGQNLEAPSIVDQLFDTEAIASRPLYQIASGFPLVLSGSEFFGLSSWHSDSDSLLNLRDHFQRISSDLSAKSALAVQSAARVKADLDKAAKCELLAILKARERQLANPVVFEILESIRPAAPNPEHVRAKLRDIFKPYKAISGDGDGDDGGGGGGGGEDLRDATRPFFKMEYTGLMKSKKYRPLVERGRNDTLEKRVEYRKDMANLIKG